MSPKRSLLALAILLLPLGAARAQHTPWLPEEGELVLTPWYTFQTFDRFWFGDDKMDFPNTDQHTVLLATEYALLDDVQLDATFGYTRTIGGMSGADVDDGLADTQLGLTWRVVDEFRSDAEWMPSVALRGGAIIEGTYEENRPESPGDGASGFETSLLLGKTYYDETVGELGVSGEIGWRARFEDVPEDFFFSAGAYKAFENGFSLDVAFLHNQGLSGPDIGDPGFTFPEVKEVQGNIQYGVGYRDAAGRSINVYAAHTLYGRNTAEKLVIGVSLSIPLDVGSPAGDLLRQRSEGDDA